MKDGPPFVGSMPGHSLRFRVAVESDAASLARFAEGMFRETFAAANTEANMAAYCAKTFGVDRQLAELKDGTMATILAEVGAELVGFGQLRQGSAPHSVGGARPMQIYRLYVDRAWHGRGVARRLMSRLMSEAFATGADTVWLGVWEHNARAIAFYAKCGFEAVGELTFVLGEDAQRDVVMRYRNEAAGRGDASLETPA